jgi:hypothetical protein
VLRDPPQNSLAGIFVGVALTAGLRPGERAVLEVVLQDARGQGGG